jgi:hypothetical protein
MTIFGLETLFFFLQTIFKRLQTAVGPALLQEKTFDIVTVDEKEHLTVEIRSTESEVS